MIKNIHTLTQSSFLHYATFDGWYGSLEGICTKAKSFSTIVQYMLKEVENEMEASQKHLSSLTKRESNLQGQLEATLIRAEQAEAQLIGTAQKLADAEQTLQYPNQKPKKFENGVGAKYQYPSSSKEMESSPTEREFSLQSELEATLFRAEQAEAESKKTAQKLKNAEQAVRILNQKLKKVENEVEANQQYLSSSKDRESNLQGQLEATLIRAELAEADLKKKARISLMDQTLLQNDFEELQEKRTRLEQTFQQLTQMVTKVENEVEAKKKNLSSTTKTESNLQGQLEAMLIRSERIEAELKRTTKNLEASEQTVRNLTQMLTKVVNEVEANQQHLSSTLKRESNLQVQLEATRFRSEQFESDLKGTTQKLEDAELTVHHLTQKLTTVEIEVETNKNHAAASMKREFNLQRELEATFIRSEQFEAELKEKDRVALIDQTKDLEELQGKRIIFGQTFQHLTKTIQRLTEELTIVENEVKANQQHLSSTMKRESNLQGQLEAALIRSAQFEAELKEMVQKQDCAEQKLHHLAKTFTRSEQVEAELRDTVKKLEDKEVTVQHLTQKLTKVENEIEANQQHLSSTIKRESYLHGQFEATLIRSEQVESELKRTAQKLEDAEQRVQRLTQKLTKVENEVEAKQKHLSSTTTRESKLQGQLKATLIRSEKVEAESKITVQKLEDAEKEVRHLIEKITKFENEVELKQQYLSSSTKRESNLEGQFKAALIRAERAEAELKATTQELEDAGFEIKTLKEKEFALSTSINGTINFMNEMNSAKEESTTARKVAKEIQQRLLLSEEEATLSREKIKNLQLRINSLEDDLHQSYTKTINAIRELGVSKRESKTLRKNIMDLKHALAETVEEKLAAKMLAGEFRQSLSLSHGETNKLKEKTKNLEHQLEASENESEALRNIVEDLEKECGAYGGSSSLQAQISETELKKSKQELKTLREIVTRLESEVAEAIKERAAADNLAAESRQNLSCFADEVSSLKKTKKRLENELEQAIQKSNGLKNHLEISNLKLVEMQKEKAANKLASEFPYKSRVSNAEMTRLLDETMKNLKNQLEVSKKESKVLRNSIEDLKNELAESMKEKDTAINLAGEFRESLSVALGQSSTLQSKVLSLEKELEQSI
jgi:chromosome segregation ATPase